MNEHSAHPAKWASLELRIAEQVAWLTLNRPDAANSVNLTLAKELLEATLLCEDAGVRAVVITGAGKVFCTGGDLKEFGGQGERLSAHLRETTVYLHAALTRLAHLEAPVIAAVNGVAAGAGMSLACACDLAIAAESARFTLAYTRAGLSPDGSGTWYLPRLIGQRRAMELALTNRTLSAAEALSWGLVTRVVADDQLMAEVESLATQLASGPTRSFGATKRLLLASWDHSLETQLELESQSIASLGASHDGVEGIAAFLEKRTPRLTGY